MVELAVRAPRGQRDPPGPDGSRPALITLGAVLLGTGAAALFVRVSGLRLILASAAVIVGGLCFLVAFVPALDPLRIYRARQYQRLRRAARYMQSLRCPNGHEYIDVVRYLDGKGLLPEGRQTHCCPECGADEGGFESLHVSPANRAARRAEKSRILAYSTGRENRHPS